MDSREKRIMFRLDTRVKKRKDVQGSVYTMVLGSCKKQEKMQKENQKLIERVDQEEVAEDKE